jgi:hypothetical protein
MSLPGHDTSRFKVWQECSALGHSIIVTVKPEALTSAETSLEGFEETDQIFFSLRGEVQAEGGD